MTITHSRLGVEPLKKKKLYQEILDRLIAAISSQEYPAGSQLPSERELMERFGVGRPAIREAMLTLQQMGLVIISHGERARVVEPTADQIIDQVSNAMVMMLATNQRGMEDLKEARIFMETGLVALAAKRATASDIEEPWRNIEDLSGDDQAVSEICCYRHRLPREDR
ncbi:GntR family transcriptional regulator [Devosia algicola]|uniref:GntR family transcriptional regulator n=1 Tax=Devosia algicola TaxID=3026418 RepID=A0ABY7YJ82_9HYPH|nr:GntR family transcriptional regulator [Devosia algicola]WDR01323.1 GntR family transcriptional regulator [Devosia algicola]